MKYQVGDVLLNTHNGGTRTVTKVNNNDTVWFEGSYGSFSTEGFVLKERKIMNKFKVGDVVRLVDTGAAERRGIHVPRVHFPNVATVKESGATGGVNSWDYVRIEEDSLGLAWPEDALELVEEKKEEIVKTFNIGDKVRVNSKKTNTNFYAQGAEGIVTNANPEDFEVQFYKGSYDPDRAGVWYVNPEHVDLIEEPVEDAAVQDLFKVGQTVWCLIFGKGEVREIEDEDDNPYPIYVVFESDGGGRSFTKEGKYYKGHNRTLYFSEPKIEAAKQPLFTPTLEGKKVLITDEDGNISTHTVEKETEDKIYFGLFGNYFVKSEIQSIHLLEQVSL